MTMTTKIPSPLSKINPSVVFLWIAVLMGGYIRLSQVIRSPFPLNDGGLFYRMTVELMKNGFRLPEITSYNHLNLPFSYPPLSLYMAGFLVKLTGWNLIDILRILPAFFTLLSIPALYFLAKDFCQNEFQAILATFIFTLIPASFNYLIMGGGITRAPAFFLALLALHSTYQLYTRRQVRYIFLTAILSALTILTHPETALHTAISAVVFFLFLGRSKAGIMKSLAVAGLTILFTSPWWGIVIARYGLNPLLAASQTGMWGISSTLQLLLFNFTNEYGLQTIGTLGLIGFLWHLAGKKFLIPVWLVVVFLSSPRSAAVYLTPCIAILAGYTLDQILRLFNRGGKKTENGNLPLTGPASITAFVVLLGLWFYSALVSAVLIANTMTLTGADKTAFDWVVANTPAESHFLILTGNFPFIDPTSEWFPALTDRESIATVQGHEWDEKRNFTDVLLTASELQYCADQIPECLDNWLTGNKVNVDYIYIRKLISQNGEEPEPLSSTLPTLLVASGKYKLVYKTEEIAILQAEQIQTRRSDGFKLSLSYSANENLP